jgi:hypothetical protein
LIPLGTRGLYRRSGITPCPEGGYSVVEIISCQTTGVKPRSLHPNGINKG